MKVPVAAEGNPAQEEGVRKSLGEYLKTLPGRDEGALLEAFLEYAEGAGLELYPAQEQAVLELFEGANVILNTPTGSGKSLVAAALHFASVAQGRRSVYTCPIKALVNEKWMALCREFGPEMVGLSTGDATVNREAPILCCTAEILAKMALREGARAKVHDVVMDEFHYYGDRERGMAWQVPLLTLPQARFLLMSATLGETAFFEQELTRATGRRTALVSASTRPVPLEFSYAETPLAQTVGELLAAGKAPIYVVHFTQADAAQSAQDFTSLAVTTREEKAALAEALEGFRFSSPYGPEVKKWLRQGIGLHHAGLLPKYRVLVEGLAQRGLLKVICGTDTLGVGINVPIRTVLLTQLCKYAGEKVAILTARDFHQITGRAGRKGFDAVGWVVAQAPAHAIENKQLAEKQAATGKKFVKRKPPERNFVNWDEATFRRLMAAPPERLLSHFQLTHETLLNVLSRPEDGGRALQKLVRECHEPARQKAALRRRGWQLFRALLERGVVEAIPRTATGARVRLHPGLQEDFALNQTLALYVHQTIPLMDPEAPDYALVVLSLAEAILENPEVILRRQLEKVKSQAVAEMKMNGVEYHQRMEELEKLEYPKPNRDFIYATFNDFAAAHPWVGEENIRPKSIAREMFEEFRTFSDYIKIYDLQRSEGVLLRHLASVHKVLRQTVPEPAKNEALREMEVYLGTLVRQVDSSLLEEWERMRDPAYRPRGEAAEVRPPGAEEATRDVTRDRVAFTAAIRARIFVFLRALQQREWEQALAVAPGEGWDGTRLETAFDEYLASHERLRLDEEGRNARHTYVQAGEDGREWTVEQMLIDPAGENDWVAEFRVGLAEAREAGEPRLELRRLGRLG